MNIKPPIIAVVFLITGCGVLAAGDRYDRHHIEMRGFFRPQLVYNENIEVYLRNGTVYILDGDFEQNQVKITRDNRLYVNDVSVATDSTGRRLTRAYYDLAAQIMKETKKIGIEGAKMGLRGAGIGAKAVVGVIRMLLPNYNSQDFERDMDEAAAKLEARAKILEEKGGLIDEKIERLKDMHPKMKKRIPALKDLEWF
ncbi:hypothetical protein JW906_08450 [bacterium]|nr:hypothetical protein [bacterium]